MVFDVSGPQNKIKKNNQFQSKSALVDIGFYSCINRENFSIFFIQKKKKTRKKIPESVILTVLVTYLVFTKEIDRVLDILENQSNSFSTSHIIAINVSIYIYMCVVKIIQEKKKILVAFTAPISFFTQTDS